MVFRRIVALGLSIAVQVSAVTMPFIHAHPDDHADAHHAAHAVHSHFADHVPSHIPSSRPVIGDDDDDRPVYLQLFVAVSAQPAPVGATALMAFDLVTPAETAAHVSVPVVHGHDPPIFRSLAPRAPPAFLS